MTLDELSTSVGTALGTSRWIQIGQDSVTAFADVTNDHQFIHLDEQRAASDTPFGGTIAHGFLLLSLLTTMLEDVQGKLGDVAISVNYGFDKVRFVSPVRTGSRVRGRFDVASVEKRKDGGTLVKYVATIEIENVERPALSAEWLGLHMAS